MDNQLRFRTSICSEYESLLKDCQRALVAWRECSEGISRLGLQGKRVGDELQRLQADYARAYNHLERHGQSCEVCRFTTELGKSQPPNQVFIFPRKELSA